MAVLDFELLSKPLILFCFYIGDGLSKAFLLKHAICHYDPSFKTFGLDLLMCNESWAWAVFLAGITVTS